MNRRALTDREITAAFEWRAQRGSSVALFEQVIERSRASRRGWTVVPGGRGGLFANGRWTAVLAALLALVLAGAVLLIGSRSTRNALRPVLVVGPAALIDPDNARWTPITALQGLDVFGQPTLAFSGSQVAFWTPAGELAVAPVASVTEGSPAAASTWRRLTGPMVHHALGGSRIVWSPDSETIAFPAIVGSPDDPTGPRETLNLISADGRQPPLAIEVDFAAANAAFSPDGTMLAFGCGDTSFGISGVHLCVAQRDGSGVRQLETPLRHGRPAVVNLSWAPDSRRIVVVAESGLAIVDVVSGTETPLGVDDGFPVWSPDGSTIAAIHDDGTVARIDAIRPDGTGLRILASDPDRPSALEDDAMPYGPAWSPDGSSIAYVNTDGRIVLLTVANGTPRVLPDRVGMLLWWQAAAVD